MGSSDWALEEVHISQEISSRPTVSEATSALLTFFIPQRSSCTIQSPFNNHSTTIQGVYPRLSAKFTQFCQLPLLLFTYQMNGQK